MQVAARIMLVVERQESPVSDHLLDERVVFGLAAVAPVNFFRLSELGHLSNPVTE